MDENTPVASLPPLNDAWTLLVRFFFNLQPSSSFKHLSIHRSIQSSRQQDRPCWWSARPQAAGQGGVHAVGAYTKEEGAAGTQVAARFYAAHAEIEDLCATKLNLEGKLAEARREN